jgi:hypothetical protein
MSWCWGIKQLHIIYLIVSTYIVIGWGWNSGQSSPTSSKDFKKLVVIRMAGAGAAAAAAAGVATGTVHVEEKVDSPTGEKEDMLTVVCCLHVNCPQPDHTFILYSSEIPHIHIILPSHICIHLQVVLPLRFLIPYYPPLPYMHTSSSGLAIKIFDSILSSHICIHLQVVLSLRFLIRIYIFLDSSCHLMPLLIVFLRSVFQLLVTTNVPSSPILVTLMMEAVHFSKTHILTRVTRHNIPEDGIL